ncbi:MAG: ABC transporter ATP-binding protein [Flavobacterium sp. MedPE-SWcel]|uniref:ABC transporter ATP-binding protein n=1 Tax=uncultured Flavobacterium sp. TaxID=165435 RepID=UPI00091E8CC0|nr:ABC transporter ATP-binding protein [uncultured Flavobacterium sp.]OIQ16884.1 MAG: ABC transporter ATP-binding protein [Flavobacterium sp. MedPE-SWcel]
MNEFEKQFLEVQDLLKFDDYNLVIKRLIDFTLDTESITFYKKTTELLDWIDNNPESLELKEKLSQLLKELCSVLVNKPISKKKKILEGIDIVKRYGASSFALGPANIKLYEGDIIGLVGENGNGKTTLLRLLSGELYATAGSIQYDFPYNDLYDLRTKLVYIPQRTDTWRGSMFENLVFTASSYGYLPQEINFIVELTIARLGLRKFRKYKWKDLSSGYKMRFELARMLLRKPKVLLIDEPLANLDILAQQTVLEDFRAIAKSPFRPIGIILSSQQLYEVEKTSDQVIFLKNGQQKNLHAATTDETIIEEGSKPLVIEFESEWTQSMLNEKLLSIGLQSIQFNGGTFIATFSGDKTVNDFMKTIITHNIHIVYFRNISNSTRRFFVS